MSMPCKPLPPCKPRVKIIDTGVSKKPLKLVQSLTLNGTTLHVENTDGTSYDLTIQGAPSQGVKTVDVLNATGSKTLATFITPSKNGN